MLLAAEVITAADTTAVAKLKATLMRTFAATALFPFFVYLHFVSDL